MPCDRPNCDGQFLHFVEISDRRANLESRVESDPELTPAEIAGMAGEGLVAVEVVEVCDECQPGYRTPAERAAERADNEARDAVRKRAWRQIKRRTPQSESDERAVSLPYKDD